MTRWIPVTCALASVFGWSTSVARDPSAQGPAPESATAEDPTRALFETHCASCHGKNGAGDGQAELDRPARSFQDGGFSFGNTPETLFRTISNGIPGTPMPGFDAALSEAERRTLAALVLEMGPASDEGEQADSRLAVGNRPEIVRGLLPPITPDRPEHPRGLLIGTTRGLTFEYRIDDVRLLGVRQGEFVERRDWTGRGGASLEPLGRLVYLVEGGAPPATFSLATDDARTELHARMGSTWIREGVAGLTYWLKDEAGRSRCRVRESCDAVTTSVAAGFRRRWQLTAALPVALELRVSTPRDATDLLLEGVLPLAGGQVLRYWAHRVGDDGIRWVSLRLPASVSSEAAEAPSVDVARVPIRLGQDGVCSLEATFVLLTHWAEHTAESLLQELAR